MNSPRRKDAKSMNNEAYAVIPLTNGNSAIVDVTSMPLLEGYVWRENKPPRHRTTYALSYGRRKGKNMVSEKLCLRMNHATGLLCALNRDHDGLHICTLPPTVTIQTVSIEEPPVNPSPSEGVYRVEKRGEGDYSYYVLGPSIKLDWCFDAEADAEDVVFALNAAHQFAFTQGMRRAGELVREYGAKYRHANYLEIARAIDKEASGGK